MPHDIFRFRFKAVGLNSIARAGLSAELLAIWKQFNSHSAHFRPFLNCKPNYGSVFLKQKIQTQLYFEFALQDTELKSQFDRQFRKGLKWVE